MKDVVDFLGQFDRCLASEPAFCMAACPFHLDVREFTERVEQGRGRAAYSLYREATGFPGIVSRICERPCEKVCPMREKGGAIRLREIERAVCADAEGAIPESYNLPARGKRVAIIGAGLCGLGCALRLAQKKYDVEIFEARDAVCGTGWESKELLETAQSEIERQFKNETVTLHLNTCVEKREDLAGRGFDAVFVCTGEGGETFETKGTKGDGSSGSRDERGRFIRLETKGDGSSGSESKENHLAHSLYGEVGAVWLTGGALTGHTGSEALAHGLRAAAAIDAFLRTGNLVFPKDVRTTKMVLAPLKLERIPASFPEEIPVDETGAAAEAARCLRCRCDACMLYADLPAYTGKWPQRIRDEVFATTLPGKSEVKATPARRLVNMDNLSGVFETVCPAGIDLDGLLLAGRQSLHRQEKMPWPFHEFHLRDMAHADSDRAALVLRHMPKSAPKGEGYAFFPGCQLGASQPELVLTAWKALKSLEGAGEIRLAGLILRCCGAPALWSGDEALFEEKLAGIRKAWEGLGRPALLLACPSCMRLFEEHLPEIEICSVYEILANRSALDVRSEYEATPPSALNEAPAFGAAAGVRGAHAVFDACAAARLSPERSEALRAGVRSLAAAAGLETQELPLQAQITRCCGFGGQPDLANPDFTRGVTEDRAAESGLPYLCYCSNCRDAFLKAGKPATHVLELLAKAIFVSPAQNKNNLSSFRLANLSQRRENREWLRAVLPGELSEIAFPTAAPKFEIPDDLLAQMEQDHILIEDAYEAFAYLKETGEVFLRRETGERTGCAPIGRTTLWISWREESSFPKLTGAYTHRIAFVPEAVWNAVRRWTPAAEQNAHPNECLTCTRHQEELLPMEAEFSYLGRSFRHPVLRCPVCGLPYIPEELARGRMRDVEMALEEK